MRPVSRMVLFIVLFISTATAQTGRSDPDIAIGVVDSEGTMLPLARFAHRDWSKFLTRPAMRDPNYRLTPGARSLARTGWKFWPTSGKEPLPLVLSNDKTKQYYCGSEISGFDTNVPAGLLKKATSRIAGIATLGEDDVYRPEDAHAQPDESSRRMARLITAVTHAMEGDVAATPRSLVSKIPPAERNRHPVVLHQLARVSNVHGEYARFEAVKAYGQFDIVVRGWIAGPRPDESLPPSLLSAVSIREVQGEARHAPYEVLGIFNLRDRTIWAGRHQGYESEALEVFDWPVFGVPTQVVQVSDGC